MPVFGCATLKFRCDIADADADTDADADADTDADADSDTLTLTHARAHTMDDSSAHVCGTDRSRTRFRGFCQR
jgi:hypothetical protein